MSSSEKSNVSILEGEKNIPNIPKTPSGTPPSLDYRPTYPESKSPILSETFIVNHPVTGEQINIPKNYKDIY